MTLLIPFLPLYVRELGVISDADVLRWSGIAFGATFLTAALAAPLWGALGDRFGRKPMLIRASLGMAVTMSLIGFAQTVWQLVALRLLVGLLGGYSSAATILVAAQAPKERTAWALGVLSSGMLAGAVAGPLLGGILPGAIGIRATFMLTGALIFCAFLATALLLHGDVKQGPRPLTRSASGQSSPSPAHSVVVLLITASMLMFATMAIEPIVAAYVTQINGPDRAIAWSGLVLALGATGSILSAPIVGRMADRVGHRRVVVGCLGTAAVCVLLQGHVANAAQLAATQLALGVCLGGLMPSVTASIRHITPPDRLGRTLGLGVSAQYVGLVLGPVTGGFVAAQTGFRSVFLVTALVLVLAAALNLAEARSRLPRANGRAVALGPRLRRSAR
ncbi:MFS transporter [Nocardioides piscis]|uniref:Multidrug efflux MFS transporter n=1 Tax=Nocardioides piscis TaxID=2714938 RepID=A0A6G7YI55_9ACTN|nr:MFS transporter [Nocardioides piscis]QIK76483.1 multidrug efflux MFS transporter [Nocardioides piscis]